MRFLKFYIFYYTTLKSYFVNITISEPFLYTFSMETILIIGAGASGLMAARELVKAGKKVIVLEARDRLGGRIAQIAKEEFGYPLEGGAEFVHGNGVVTKALLAEAGLHVVPVEGDYWSVRTGEPKKNDFLEVEEGAFIEKLSTLSEDMPIGTFLDTYFSGEENAVLRNDVTRMVEGYDAADMGRASALAVHQEWANEEAWQQGRVVEGYGAMIAFLESECRKLGVELLKNKQVTGITIGAEIAQVTCKDNTRYEAQKIILTVPLPIIKTILFSPAIPEKLAAIEKMGFGPAIKIFLKFNTAFWKTLNNGDYANMQMIISNELLGTWWTPYPDPSPILTGWFAGPKAWAFIHKTEAEIIETALECLAVIFNITKDELQKEIARSKIMNWPADPYTQGAYSYTTIETKEVLPILQEPINNILFFAGEALYNGKDIATVEGALASGKDVVEKILHNSL